MAPEDDRGGRRARRRRDVRLPRGQRAGRRDAPPADPQGHLRGRVLSRSSAARPSRTRACSRCSTRWSTSCRARSRCRRSRASTPKTERGDRAPGVRRRAAVDARLQDHERPLRRLAHLLPHLFRQARIRLDAGEHGEGEARAHRPHAAHACEQPRRDQGSLRRRHRRRGRPEGHDDRRHALRPAEAGHPGAHGVPRAGHRDRHRAEFQGRPGEDGRGAQPPGRRGSVLPRQDRRGIRPDDHRRHGRASPRHHRRPHEARVQGRGERRPAAGRLSRDDHAGCGSRLHAQEADRRLRPVRPREDALRAAGRRRRASSSRTRSSAATSRANTCRACRRASPAP